MSYKKIVWIALALFIGIGSTRAAIDLEITDIVLSNGNTTAAQFSTPAINLTIANNGTTDVAESNINAGFIRCTRTAWTLWTQEIYVSNPIWAFTLGAWSTITITNQSLNNVITNTAWQGKQIICWINESGEIQAELATQNNSTSFSFDVVPLEWWNFDLSLWTSINPIQWNLNAIEPSIRAGWVVNFVTNLIIGTVIPIIIVVWVLVAILWLYKILFSNEENDIQKWTQYIIRGVVGIIIMISARYVWNVLFDTVFQSWNAQAFSWIFAVETIYEQVVIPFLTLISYLVIWILFIILLTRVFTLLTSDSEDSQKKAWTIIIRSVFATLIILWAKQIVELVYGRREQVLEQNAQNLWDIWEGVLVNNAPLIYQIINWILGLTAFIVLILIIIQSYKLLTNPDSEDNLANIKKTILYVFLGIIVIGAWYVIVNFLIIN